MTQSEKELILKGIKRLEHLIKIEISDGFRNTLINRRDNLMFILRTYTPPKVTVLTIKIEGL